MGEEGGGGEIGAEEFGEKGLLEDEIGEGVVGEIDLEDFCGEKEVPGLDRKGDDGWDFKEGELEGDGARFSEGEVGVGHEIVGVGGGNEEVVRRGGVGMGRRDGDFEGGVLGLEGEGGVELDGEVAGDFLGSASGEKGDEAVGRREVVAGAEGGIGSELRDGKGEGMAYVMGLEGGVAKAGGFKGKEGEEEIEV